jgi:AcrR family transcriptional regulator
MDNMQSIIPESKAKILEAAIPLFAEAGFNGVSMRSLATEVGLNPATLYHHFQDKHTLYMAAMSFAFARRAETLSVALSAEATPEERLKKFAEDFCRLIHDDPDFNKLIQREILAGDNKRLQLVARQVFYEFFTSLRSLCDELAPGFDSHMLVISIVGLVVYHYQIAPLRQHLLGRSPAHDFPEEVATHVVRLLLGGVKGGELQLE